jgi:hypothetical protein
VVATIRDVTEHYDREKAIRAELTALKTKRVVATEDTSMPK